MDINFNTLLFLGAVVILVYFVFFHNYMEPMILDQKIPTCFDISPKSIELIKMMEDDNTKNSHFLKKLNEMLCFHKKLIYGESTRQMLQNYILVPAGSASNRDLISYLFDKIWTPNLGSGLDKLITKLPTDRQTMYRNKMKEILQVHRRAILDLIPEQP